MAAAKSNTNRKYMVFFFPDFKLYQGVVDAVRFILHALHRDYCNVNK